MFRKILISILLLILIFISIYFLLSKRSTPEKINYGVSFNTLYARELKLDWEEVFDAILNDLNVRRFRLAAHWNMVEPENNEWNFEELDKQIELTKEAGAEVILSVGRRLPRWPECHVPHWAINKEWEDQKKEILEYMEVVINRYKDYEHIVYWQIENEPFLEVFAKEHCRKLDEKFFAEQIEFARELDSSRKILVTDSGNLGTWYKPWKYGDLFGTSVYVYLWNPDIGPFKSYLPPSFYRFKTSLMELIIGKQESMLIELSLEPWLLQPVVETPLKIQLERMNIEKFREIINFAEKTKFEYQYLWGAEWWYYMSKNNHPEFWEEAKKLFN
jgi:hypothetical protein